MSKAVNGSENHFDEVLRNLMVPRVVGTPSHQKVKEVCLRQGSAPIKILMPINIDQHS